MHIQYAIIFLIAIMAINRSNSSTIALTRSLLY